MTLREDSHPSSSVEAYVDGLLSPAERAAFESRLVRDPELAREVRVAREVDARLCKLFKPPAVDAAAWVQQFSRSPSETGQTWNVNGTSHGPRLAVNPSAAPARGRSRLRRGVAIAACVGAVGYAGFVIQQELRPPQRVDAYRALDWRSMEYVYNEESRDGFKPDWVCKTDEVFMETFESAVGKPMLLAQASLPGGAYCAGLSYWHTLSPRSIAMLGRYGDARILVCIDRLEHDKAARDMGTFEVSNPSLHLFRREVGDIVMYELTPLETPVFLDGMKLVKA